MTDPSLPATATDGYDEEEFGLLDESNPRSLVNIAPDVIAAAMKRIDKSLIYADEAAIRERASPSDTLDFLRLNFWMEYNVAQEKRAKMRLKLVHRGVSLEFLHKVVLVKDANVAWLITPPADYTTIQTQRLYKGLERLKDILSMDLYKVRRKQTVKPNGDIVEEETREPNAAAIAEIRKIVEYLTDRVQGSVVQKIAVKGQMDSRHQISPALPGLGLPATYDPGALDDLTKMLGDVRGKLAALEAPALPVKALTR